MADDRVVLSVKSRGKGLYDRLLLEKSERAEASVGKEGLFGNAKLQAQGGEERLFVAGRQRIAQPLPRIPFVAGFHHPSRLEVISPSPPTG